MTDGFETLTTTRLGDSAYAQVATALMAGRLPPETKITIRSLAEALGTSTTPVRDAVMRLIQEGALEQRSLRDVRVPLLTPEQFREIISMRMELEGLAAFHAAARMTPEHVCAIEALIEANEAAIKDADWDRASACNQQFHFAIIEAAEMPMLRNVLGGLWLRSGPIVAQYYRHGGRTMIDRHYEIVKLLKARDGAAARRVVAEDVDSVTEAVCAFLKAYGRDKTLKL